MAASKNNSQSFGHQSFGTSTPTQFDRMLAGRSVLQQIWRDHRFAIAIPVSLRPILHLGDDVEVIEEPSLVKSPFDGLDQKERQPRLEKDRDIRFLEAEVGEEGAEPTIRFDDAFKKFVAKAARKVCASLSPET
jgi:hypothetical protein